MKYIYKMSVVNHLIHGWPILIYAVVFWGLKYYMEYRFGPGDVRLFNLTCFFLFLIFLIPQLLIHLTYYWLNEGRIFQYNPLERNITIVIRGKEHDFSFDDIESIELYKSFALSGLTYQWMPWDNYNYSIIRLKKGQKFIITSLLVPNMNIPLGENKIKLRKRFYAYPFGVKEVFDV